MASFQRRGAGWRAQVRRGGVSRSETFRTKSEAQAWAERVEADLRAGRLGYAPTGKTFADLVRRYVREVLPAKDGERPERLRLERLIGGQLAKGVPPDPLGAVLLSDLRAEHFAAWRDRRLRAVSAASVRREWSTLSHACNIARREWHWLAANPLAEVAKPAAPQPRKRRISADEIERLLLSAGYERDAPPTTATARAGAALLFAIETAMRAGEICALQWGDVDFEQRTAAVRALAKGARKTKVGRVVPLSGEALRILRQLPASTTWAVFGLQAASLDALFRKIKARAMVDDLHFHDSRREALTRLAKKVDVMTLAKISGHHDLRILLDTYYAPDMSEVAGLID